MSDFPLTYWTWPRLQQFLLSNGLVVGFDGEAALSGPGRELLQALRVIEHLDREAKARTAIADFDKQGDQFD